MRSYDLDIYNGMYGTFDILLFVIIVNGLPPRLLL